MREEEGPLLSKDVEEALDKVLREFAVPTDISPALVPIILIKEQLSSAFSLPIDTFCAGIRAVNATTTFPYHLVNSTVATSMDQWLPLAEGIVRKYGVFRDDLSGSEGEGSKITDMRRKLRDFRLTPIGRNAGMALIAHHLLDSLKVPDQENVAQQILFQANVSLWSVFESGIKDLLITVFNEYPLLCDRFMSHSATKKHFEIQKVSFELISNYNYDISSKMGDIMLRYSDLSDITIVKAAVKAMNAKPEVVKALGDSMLWMLNQNRHLIVHRRGVVDERYLKNTGSSYNVGHVITISPLQWHDTLNCVIKAMNATLDTVVDFLKSCAELR